MAAFIFQSVEFANLISQSFTDIGNSRTSTLVSFSVMICSSYCIPFTHHRCWYGRVESGTDRHVTTRNLLETGLLSLEYGSRLVLVEHHTRTTDSPGQLGCCGRCRLAANQDMNISAGQNTIYL